VETGIEKDRKELEEGMNLEDNPKEEMAKTGLKLIIEIIVLEAKMNESMVPEKIRVSPMQAAEKDRVDPKIVINLLIEVKAINKV